MKKIVALLTCVLLLTAMLTGCFSGTKEYTCQDLTMSVPFKMKDVSSNSDFSEYTFTLDSDEIAIFGLREPISDIVNGPYLSVKDYTDAVLKANENKGKATQRSNQDYYYFQYESTGGGITHQYVAACFKGKEAFWLVQIAAPKADFELETYLGYLDTVELN